MILGLWIWCRMETIAAIEVGEDRHGAVGRDYHLTSCVTLGRSKRTLYIDVLALASDLPHPFICVVIVRLVAERFDPVEQLPPLAPISEKGLNLLEFVAAGAGPTNEHVDRYRGRVDRLTKAVQLRDGIEHV